MANDLGQTRDCRSPYGYSIHPSFRNFSAAPGIPPLLPAVNDTVLGSMTLRSVTPALLDEHQLATDEDGAGDRLAGQLHAELLLDAGADGVVLHGQVGERRRRRRRRGGGTRWR